MRAIRSDEHARRCRDVAVWLLIAAAALAAAALAPRWVSIACIVPCAAVAGLLARDFRRRLADADKQLDQLRRENDALHKSESQFVAHVTHEIRTPMSSILGFSEVLLEPDATRPERRDALLAIQRNARHLLDLVNQILDFSKIEAGQMPVERTACDLPGLIAEAVGLTRPAIVDKGLLFKLTLDGPVPQRIQTDPLRVRQILVNLIANAARFTEFGAIELRVGCRTADASVGRFIIRFDVIDTGIGMTADQTARLFRPFAQADESVARRFGGTGLGLTIAQSLARLLGGDITVRSEPNAGSTFTVEVEGGPVAAGTPMLDRLKLPDERDLVAACSAAHSRSVPRCAGRILLAEDGADSQRLIARHLRRAGATVAVAATGRAAVERIAAEPFDLILMDLRMPDLDGHAAVARIRAAGVATPVVALTANAAPGERERCLAAGFDGYLTKPIEKHKLLVNVARYLAPAPAVPDSAKGDAVPAAPAAGDLPMTSLLADEPDLGDLLDEFVHMLPAKVRELQDRLAHRDTVGLRELAHQIKGAAGGYGFPHLSACAGKLEGQLHSGASAEAIRRTIDALVSLIRKVHGYPLHAEHPSRRDVA